MRKNEVLQALKENDIKLESISAVVGRGGLLPPVKITEATNLAQSNFQGEIALCFYQRCFQTLFSTNHIANYDKGIYVTWIIRAKIVFSLNKIEGG